MNEIELPKTEANVVILLRHSSGRMRIIPVWECTTDQTSVAAGAALHFAEECGCGDVTVEITIR